MAKKNVLIFVFALIPVILIWTLHQICYRDNIPQYDFERKFGDKQLIEENSIQLKNNYVKIIGAIENSLYMYTDDLTSLAKINLIDESENLIKNNHSIQNANITGNKIYTFSIRPKSYSILDQNLKLLKTDSIKSNFDRAVNFKNLNYYRSTNSKSIGEFITTDDSGLERTLHFNVSDSTTVDGGITTDGYFVAGDNRLFYIEYHKGKFYQLDSDKIKEFNMPYVFDKVNGFEKNGNTFLINRPIISKNKFSCIDQNLLYNASFVKSSDQSLKRFTKHITVDVCNVTNGKYLYSFYIPNHKNEKPLDMLIINKNIYILYGKNLTKFKIK